jgi:peptide/nickel transport system permease protein
MLSRVIYGTRYTLGASLLATVLACGIGTALGILAAVRGGWTDTAISRTADTFISIPHLMLALVIVAALGSSLPVLIGLIAFSYVPGAFRIARSLAVNVNAMEFVQVARARGEGTAYIVMSEILPNMVLPVLTDFGLRFVFAVLLLSSLGFLGLGIQPPNADWGALVRENMDGLYEASPAVIIPAIAIATLTVAVNLVIDAFSGHPTDRR